MKNNLLALLPILVAAFSYPLGNRKMMEICPTGLDTMQRVFGMVLCSAPFWLITAVAAFLTGGAPSGGQVLQSVGVAVFSGIIATSLFFHATDLVRNDPKQLAVIEATQCGEVIFTLLAGVFILRDAAPTAWGYAGIALIVIGMVVNSLSTRGGSFIKSPSRLHIMRKKERSLAMYRDEITALTECFVRQLAPLEIYLFGSYADGTFNEDSDFDFFIVVEDDRNAPMTELIAQAYKSIRGKRNHPVDILVGTKQRFEERKNFSTLEGEVYRKGVLLYAARYPDVA